MTHSHSKGSPTSSKTCQTLPDFQIYKQPWDRFDCRSTQIGQLNFKKDSLLDKCSTSRMAQNKLPTTAKDRTTGTILSAKAWVHRLATHPIHRDLFPKVYVKGRQLDVQFHTRWKTRTWPINARWNPTRTMSRNQGNRNGLQEGINNNPRPTSIYTPQDLGCMLGLQRSSLDNKSIPPGTATGISTLGPGHNHPRNIYLPRRLDRRWRRNSPLHRASIRFLGIQHHATTFRAWNQPLRCGIRYHQASG